jgi:pimeloyl-ACP methyl ester carboxylesterase
MPVLLLHGALGSRTQLAPLAAALGQRPTQAMDLSGHGACPLPPEGLSFAHFLDDIDAALDAAGWEQAHLFGYSMGGYAALLYAARRPGRVRSVATLGTKLNWDRAGLERELRMLQPATMRAKVPAFVAQLAAAHGADRWEALVHATAQLITGLHERPLLDAATLATIACPVLLCVGDQDRTAVPEDTLAAARRIPHAGTLVLPRTGHPVGAVHLPLLLGHLEAFWG